MSEREGKREREKERVREKVRCEDLLEILMITGTIFVFFLRYFNCAALFRPFNWQPKTQTRHMDLKRMLHRDSKDSKLKHKTFSEIIKRVSDIFQQYLHDSSIRARM